ncbi:MAG: hypothetical protein WCJ37_13125 [Syntrophus sp. (in: bacteria)]
MSTIQKVSPIRLKLASPRKHIIHFHLKASLFMGGCHFTDKEEADLLQKGEIGFQMYARFPMGFIGWPNLTM